MINPPLKCRKIAVSKLTSTVTYWPLLLHSLPLFISTVSIESSLNIRKELIQKVIFFDKITHVIIVVPCCIWDIER